MSSCFRVSCLSLVFAILTGCSSGIGSTFADGKINKPGNLTTDIHAITKSGDNAIRIYNNGQMGVSINSGSITSNQTKDAINEGASDCFGKTLSSQQACTVSIYTYEGEAGVTELDLATNNGTYKLPINVDTSGGGVLETDTNVIATTKEKVISLYNKGAMPLTLSAFHMEDGDTTLIAKDSLDNHCLNATLDSGKACQIKVKASPAMNKDHILSVTTSNSFLKVQDLHLYEKTDVNKVNLYRNESSNNVFTVDTPEKNTFVLKNNGSDDINISKLDFTGTTVGDVVSNTCNGAILQAGDACNIELNVNTDAHESGIFTINTAEKLESAFDYKVMVNSNNLAFEGVNDAIIHTSSTKQLNILNNSNFDVKVDSVSYDAALMQLDTSACNGVIAAHGRCAMPVKSKEAKADAEITFNEFSGGVIKAITLHINDGVSIIAQPKGNNYYASLPQDGNLYQVFTVVNNTDKPQGFSLTTQHNEIATFMRIDDIPSAFVDTNCITSSDSNVASVAPQSQCEIIIREPSDLNIVQPFEQSILQVEVDYSDTQDIFVHRYQAQVLTHNEHRDATYQPNQIVNPKVVNEPGHLQITQSTLVYNNPGQGSVFPYSVGIVLSIEPDLTTIKAISFLSSSINRSYSALSYLSIQNGALTVTDASGAQVMQQAMPTSNKIAFNKMDDVIFFMVPYVITSYIMPQSYCDDVRCYLLLDINSVTHGDICDTISFTRPLPARDWTVVDAVVWNDIGTISKKK